MEAKCDFRWPDSASTLIGDPHNAPSRSQLGPRPSSSEPIQTYKGGSQARLCPGQPFLVQGGFLLHQAPLKQQEMARPLASLC